MVTDHSLKPRWTRDVIFASHRLSPWLSQERKLAGMDGNRTHPGRLNSAPQTVLKTLVVVLNTDPARKGH